MHFSRYSHFFDLGDDIALYNALRLKPVYLDKSSFNDLKDWLASTTCENIEDSPINIKSDVDELFKYKILVNSDSDDDSLLKFVKKIIPKPAINVCYMITSEQCNLACKYCFLGNNDSCTRSNFIKQNMSQETADKAIDFFVQQIKLSHSDCSDIKPALIFYGGEPLVNYPILAYIARKINDLKEEEQCLKNIEMSVVTNGTLLTRERLLELKELNVGVAISVDGFTAIANSMRIDMSGKEVFPKIIKVLDLCKELEINISLSVTLSEETIKDLNGVLKLVDNYGIKALGFNIMMSDKNFTLPLSYNEKAAQFIIDSFIELRKRGIYEDRMMRKLKAFSKSQLYFSDCAATSGGQIVVAPDGQVGICHACLNTKDYFVSNVDDKDFNATQNDSFIEWAQLTPINNSKCQSCCALGICGGGCPINASKLKEGNSIHDIDERFCIHSKKTLEFLIKDLYRILKSR